MIELVRTNDIVHLSWVRAVLEDAGIEVVLVDHYTAGMEGSIGAIPRRLLVHEDDESAARRVLAMRRAELEEEP